MKLNIYITLLMAGFFCTSMYGQRDCGSTEYLESQIKENPERGVLLNKIEQHTRQFIQDRGKNERAVVTIPVVVHIIYNSSAENISDAQIQTQIDVLNEDFRRLNSDANNTWSQAADSEVQFCLASVDPNGNSTNGITRTSTSSTSFGTNDQMKFNSSGGKDAWPAGDYMNMWVCDISGSILGYAQFPGGGAATDGIVIDYQYFGTIGTSSAPFDLGRTATHEVGHWLNLRHIWGDGNCNADDFVADTPGSDAPNYGCPSGHVSCSSVDMIENYMDYTDDACMNLFTEGQKSRMQSLFSGGGFRASLLNSNGCGQGTAPTCSDGIQNGNETGVDCGGPDCAPCQSGCSTNEVTVTIKLDNYPEETSWTIKNSGGSTVASGGTYGSQADGSTVTITECLADGCYDFIINDTYGDGICCSYGSGNYTVTSGGSTLASGGSFGSSETTYFCLESGPAPTCTDGIQNGNETGVDCGGPDCAPCVTPPTCTDGIQNGNETGVDCGGPDCAPCVTPPTCTDGIQNGNETGVDCGGPDCAPCVTPPTCTDGIQNGNETGVDCGGPDCAPCPTGTTNIFAHYFETGWDGWADGGSDCYRYNGSRSYEGTRSIRLRDNSGIASSMTSSTYNLAGYSSVQLTFFFYPRSMENGEDFFVRYNDGSSWQTVATYARGTHFSNNSFYTATVTLDGSQYNLTSNAQFRFQCDASANSDQIYIDEVTLDATSGAKSSGSSQSIELVSTPNIKAPRDVSDLDFEMTPNPATDIIHISLEDEINKVRIYSVTGQLLRSINAKSNQMNINVSELISGLYLMSVETADEIMTQRFVKQ